VLLLVFKILELENSERWYIIAIWKGYQYLLKSINHTASLSCSQMINYNIYRHTCYRWTFHINKDKTDNHKYWVPQICTTIRLSISGALSVVFLKYVTENMSFKLSNKSFEQHLLGIDSVNNIILEIVKSLVNWYSARAAYMELPYADELFSLMPRPLADTLRLHWSRKKYIIG